MSDERKQDEAIDLVPVDSDRPEPLFGVPSHLDETQAPPTWRERLTLYHENKRREFEEALELGYVRDPFSWSAFFISLAVSAALSAASYLISSALRPKPKPFRRGEMSGEVQGLMRSEQGILRPEIFGADPGDGKGGIKAPCFIFWASKIRKTVRVETTPTRSGKGFGGSRTSTTEVVEYDLDYAAGGGRGPLRVKRAWGNSDKLFDLDKRGVYEGEDAANTFTAPYLITDYVEASDGKDVTLQGGAGTSNGGAVQYNAVVSNGAATRDITIYYVNTATFTADVTVNGVTTAVNFPNSNNAYSSVVISRALNNGNNVIKIKNTSPSFNLRIDRIFCFPGLTGDETTGILDETSSADTGYTPTSLPDASVEDNTPLSRHNFVPPEDVYESTTGTINLAGYSNYATYKGVPTQLQDPVIQSDIDGKYGAGSTPAYRKWAYFRFSVFKLTRWGSVMPNITALWENEIYKNCAQIYGQWCERVGLLTTDYDFSGVATAKCRGLLVSGRRYAPKEVMAETEDIYDTIFYETEGKIYSILQPNAPQITIPESEIGWGDDEEEDFPSLGTSIEPEIDTPKRVTVKFIDPDREYEPNTQDEVRLITTGRREDSVDVAITLTATEARAVAAKKLYRAHTEAVSHPFTLPWTYLYLHPGYIINTTRGGISLSIQLVQIKGGISILECEGVAIENAVLTQSVSTSGGGVFEKPPVPIPTSTVLTIMDLPTLRDSDYAVNQGGGDLHAAAPRTSTAKAWGGAIEYTEVNGEYVPLVEFKTPCVMGTVVNVQPTTSNFTTKETGYTIDVDLFGSDAVLTNVTDAQASAGTAGLCVFGNEAEGVTTWTKLGGFPNRWRGTGFFRGRRNTQGAVAAHVAGERFVLINASVKFVPRSYTADRNVARNYKAVTSGQSFDDAAVVPYTWTGISMTSVTTAPTSPSITFDGTSLIHQVTAPSKYKELQISLVDDENTFTDAGNLVWKGKSTKWPDSQLLTDPRSATRYFRILGPWDNPSSIVPASYNVTAPAAPTVANDSQKDRQNFILTVTPAAGYNTNWIKQTHVQCSTAPDYSVNVKNFTYGGYMKNPKVSKTLYGTVKKFYIRVRFYDAWLNDPGAWSA